MSLRETFTEDVIKHYKTNKHEITSELLEVLRSYGNEGKQIALDILDIEKDEEQYYVDAFENRISFNGNRGLKKAFVSLNLSPIHKEEIEKCAQDIHYFKDNYVKIKTPKGVNFPDIRDYQNEFIDLILPDEHENIAGKMGRQSGKSVSTGIYLSWMYNFNKDLNIGIVGNKGAQAREFLSVVKNIILELPIWLVQGTVVWNKGSIENESKMRILTDVPNSDAFRGFTISILVVDEAAFIRTSVWEEFIDSIMPSQSGLSWKKNIIISTMKGMNHWYEITKGAEKGENGFVLYDLDWKRVPRFNSTGEQLTPEEFQHNVVMRFGEMYFNQNYANEAIGSSATLISSATLKTLESKQPEEIRDGKLKIYEYPEAGHQYIMSVDPAKDGKDAFAVQIVDITDFKFKQVASAQLQIDYLLMPEYINDWCDYYNKPYLIIENNEGAGQSIADQMRNDYEYENLHYDKDIGKNKKKKYPGFRTTPRSRKQILQTLKLFMENVKLDVVDKSTINEFFQFILINNKYQADEGSHDDMVMSLALIFVPFCNSKNFEDMRRLVDNLYDKYADLSDKANFGELLTIGSFDDGVEYDETRTRTYTWNGYEITEEY